MSKHMSKTRFAIVFIIAALGLIITFPGVAHGASRTDGETTTSTVRSVTVIPTADLISDLPLCESGVENPDGSKRTYQDYALCMAAQLNVAIQQYEQKKYDEAIDSIGEAYFGWYENQLEPPSMTLPGNRKVKMEGRFTRVKLAIKSNPTDPSIVEKLQTIQIAVARDAMVLDGVLPKTSHESEGKKLLVESHKEQADTAALRTVDFVTSMTLLLREGLEAMLVVLAIVLYLIKSGNKRLVKSVYLGVVPAIVLSFLLAWVMKALIGGAGEASELIEGFTMFLAVGMLFYVSNWMLSKSEGQNWSHYIQGMVNTSVSSGAAKALIFAAFLAVIREGAELVLFYTAAFSDGGHDPRWIGLGFACGVLILAVIFVVFRYGGARLPVRPIFMTTSILLFVMCISFVGKGVQELREAGIILGSTNLPWVHYYLPELGIFPQAETLLPQLILLVASVWIIIAHVVGGRKARKKEQAEALAGSDQHDQTPTPASPEVES